MTKSSVHTCQGGLGTCKYMVLVHCQSITIVTDCSFDESEIQMTEVHAEALEVGCSVAEPVLLYFIYNSIVLFLNKRDVLNTYTLLH